MKRCFSLNFYLSFLGDRTHLTQNWLFGWWLVTSIGLKDSLFALPASSDHLKAPVRVVFVSVHNKISGNAFVAALDLFLK